MTSELRSSYAACARVQRRHDPTFYLATRGLPAEVRPAVHAVYAFVRTADELVDGRRRPKRPEARRAALDRLEADLMRALAGKPSSSPAIAALRDAGERHGLPLDELHVYMDSMRRDCGPVRIASQAELDDYMDGSAATVGRIMAPLLGAAPPAHESFARLGVAFQLTNFLRDVREDYGLDRIYLPADVRSRYAVGEDQIARREATPGFRAVLAVEVDRARELFGEAAPALDAVEPRVRRGMRIARAVYVGVLDRIEGIGYDVLRRRAGLPPWELCSTALRSVREPS